MNPISLLTTAVDNLWLWTYGIVAGWGVTFTLLIAVLILISVKLLKLSRRVTRLENRLVHAERDYNLGLQRGRRIDP